MIRIFIGCAPNGEDAESQAVLDYTLCKHSSMPIEICWMKMSHDPESFWSGWNSERWPTPFSAFRWGIPAACNFEGRAIYMDSDIIVQGDIAELWSQDMHGKAVLAKHGGRLCVSLWDCAKARSLMLPIEKLKSDPASHKIMGQRLKASKDVGVFEGHWNCLDGEGFENLDDPRVKAIHYTDMSCQPHLRHALNRLAAAGQRHWFDGNIKPHPRHDLEKLFDRLLEEAEATGYRTENYVPNELYGDFKKKSLVGYKGRAA